MSLYGLIVGFAIVIGIDYFEKHSPFLSPKLKNIFILLVIFFSLVGARTYHVLDQWLYYSQYPSEIIATWHGGISILGALVFGLIFTLIFSIKTKINFLTYLNAITPILPLCQAIGRLGNWINHENPIWWPEALLNLGLFLIIRRFPAQPTIKYLIGYGSIRFITEFWRQDVWIYQSIKIGQLFSFCLILLGITLMFFQKRARIKHV